MTPALRALLSAVTGIARGAGEEILAVYASDAVAATTKADRSPLTAADMRAHQLIVRALAELTPDLPVLSEEGASGGGAAQRAAWRRYWLVDPLDGTKEFLARNGQFTVNIALIEDHVPVLGIVHVPVGDVSYQGLPGTGAWRQHGPDAPEAIHVAARSDAVVRVAASRSHRGDSLGAFLDRLGAHELISVGSSLKFCMVAAGAADVYPRLGPTSEWDTAAAHAVVVAAGGTVAALDGTPLRYNSREGLINPSFVAFGPGDHDWLALLR